MTNTYDWSERAIRYMVKYNHEPEENVMVSGAGSTVLSQPTCKADHQPWPCPLIKELREWVKFNMSSREQDEWWW